MVKKEKKKKPVKAVVIKNKGEIVSATQQAEALISQAIDKGVPVETMEKLLALKERVDAENARKDYYESMAKFQSECPIIERKKSVKGGDGKIRYSYAPLEDIISQKNEEGKRVKELIKDNGFSYFFKSEEKEDSVKATCLVRHISGHNEESPVEIPINRAKSKQGFDLMNNQQQVASALTYAKRYAFCNAFGIMTGDDDDDSNSIKPDQKKEEKKHNDDLLESSIKIVEKENDVNILKEFKKGIEKSEKYSDKDKKKLLEKVEQKINELDVNNSEKTSELEPNDNG